MAEEVDLGCSHTTPVGGGHWGDGHGADLAVFECRCVPCSPILIPFAIAGVASLILLEPVVARIVSWGTSRRRAVLAVFAVMTIALTGILIWIIPAIGNQAGHLARRLPTYSASK